MITLVAAAFLTLAQPQMGELRDGVVHLNAQEAAELIRNREGLKILDVRTRPEFRSGHIAGAIQLNYFRIDFKKQIADQEFPNGVLVHCQSGGRSARAVRILKAQGVETIYHLDGGMVAWQNAEFPVVMGDEEATE